MSMIKINLNQTVSKTELKEKKADRLKWAIFGFITLGFLALITFQTIVIIQSNNVANDLEFFNTHLKGKIGTNTGAERTSYEDIEKLKGFEESKRVFWGPKLIALIELLPDDVAITKMQLDKGKTFKLEYHARYENPEDNKQIEQDLYIKNLKILNSLKGSDFNEGFGKTLSSTDGERVNKKGTELVQYTISGTLRQVLVKNRRSKKKKKK